MTDNETGRIETLTRHFQHNFVSLGIHAGLLDTKASLLTDWMQGVVYEFGVSPDNTAFRDAPDIILKSLAQLTYFGQRAVASSQEIFSSHQWQSLEGSTIMKPWVAPNELLALAYMEDDSISVSSQAFHHQFQGSTDLLDLCDSTMMMARTN